MSRLLALSLVLAGCSGKADDTGGVAAAPSIAFLAPEDGAVLNPGPVDISLVVDGFTLVEPTKHTEDGEALSGYIVLSYDDGGTTLTESTGATQASITLNGTGTHTIAAELVYDDGDSLDPAVTASVTVDVEVGGM